jgi:predicted Zn-dependent protease
MLGENEQALEAYKSAAKTDPDFAPSYLGMALVEPVVKANASPEKNLLKAVELDPYLGEASLELVRYYIGKRNIDAAAEELANAEEIIAHSPALNLYAGQIAMAEGDLVSALENAELTISKDRMLLPAYLLLGEAALESGLPRKALEALQTYLVYEVDNADAWSLLGRSLYETGSSEKQVLDALDKALALDGNLAEAYLYRGLQYLDQEEIQEAINDLTLARRLNPKDFAVSTALGRAMLAAGYLPDARYHLDNSLAYANTDLERAEVYYWRAQVHEKNGYEPGAIQDWNALLELRGDTVPEEWIQAAEDNLQALVTPTPKKPTPTKRP